MSSIHLHNFSGAAISRGTGRWSKGVKTGTVKKVYRFDLDGLPEPANLDVLRKLFTSPDELRRGQTTVGITEEAAGRFAELADRLRDPGVSRPRNRVW